MAKRISVPGLLLTGLTALVACEDRSGPPAVTADSAVTVDEAAAPDDPETATSEAKATPPSEASTGGAAPPAGAQELTHLGPRPDIQPAACAPLPTKPSPLQPLASAIRRLACEPDLYYQPGSRVEAALGLPEGVSFRFSGPRSVALELTEPVSASELAAAMGVAQPKVTSAKSGPWALKQWFMVTNDAGLFAVWGPGEVKVSVAYSRSSEDDINTVKPLGSELTERWIGVIMPAAVVPVIDDPVALAQLKRAIDRASNDRSLLALEPAAAAKALGLDGERFRVTRRTSTTLDVWVARSQIAAAPLIEALHLEGEIGPQRARDASDTLLYDGSSESHTYGHLGVTPRFERRDGAAPRDTDPDAYVLEGISLH